jgi:hypothetical protein
LVAVEPCCPASDSAPVTPKSNVLNRPCYMCCCAESSGGRCLLHLEARSGGVLLLPLPSHWGPGIQQIVWCMHMHIGTAADADVQQIHTLHTSCQAIILCVIWCVLWCVLSITLLSTALFWVAPVPHLQLPLPPSSRPPFLTTNSLIHFSSLPLPLPPLLLCLLLKPLTEVEGLGVAGVQGAARTHARS